jgi:hypothetical protein
MAQDDKQEIAIIGGIFCGTASGALGALVVVCKVGVLASMVAGSSCAVLGFLGGAVLLSLCLYEPPKP